MAKKPIAPVQLPALLVESSGATHCVAVNQRVAPAKILFLGVRYALTDELTRGRWPVYQEETRR